MAKIAIETLVRTPLGNCAVRKELELKWYQKKRRFGGGCGPEPWYLRLDKTTVARVELGYADLNCTQKAGYYWCCSEIPELGIRQHNTCNSPARDVKTAKAEAMAHVKSCIEAKAAGS